MTSAGFHPEFVHEAVLRDADHLSRLIANEGAHVYICGGASGFGTAIRQTINKLVQNSSGSSVEEMFEQKRYHEDLAD
jgi:sulfite reductase alpha subunit-like flavoprotein